MIETLNTQQQIATHHVDGPLLVLAGAGSGKTRIVTFRIVHLLHQGVPASAILGLTFTNKAAAEMRERVNTMTAHHVLISTFHSLGVRILRESIHQLGYSASFTIYDEEDSLKLLKGCIEQLGLSKEKETQAKTVREFISQAKNQLIMPDSEALTNLSHYEPIFGKAYALYQSKLQEYNAVDFDDLLFLTVRLFKEHPTILKDYQQRWHYLLIDEYQDTNEAQYTLVKLLVAKSNNLFVVGDPDQSIYSWRGANLHNILNFKQDYPDALLVRLEQNYRSRSNILNAANELISNNIQRYEKRLWSDRGEGSKLILYIGDDERSEASFVVRQINQLREVFQIPLSEIAIFYRTNFQSRIFEDALLSYELPYVIVGGISFYLRKEIKDILAFLRLVYSGSDFISFVRTVNLPKRGLGEATLEKIRLGAEKAGLPILAFCLEATKESPSVDLRLTAKQRDGLTDFAKTMQDLQQVAEEGNIKELVLATIKRTGYLNYLKEDKESFEDRKSNLNELVGKAAEWQENAQDPSLAAFLEELSLKSTLDEVSDIHERINLMTLHNGKGLEFDAVFIVGLEEDLLPHANSKEDQDALEEERRLCYVGMTRAKEHLYLTAARHRFMWGMSRFMRLSRFLQEIPPKYLKKVPHYYELEEDD